MKKWGGTLCFGSLAVYNDGVDGGRLNIVRTNISLLISFLFLLRVLTFFFFFMWCDFDRHRFLRAVTGTRASITRTSGMGMDVIPGIVGTGTRVTGERVACPGKGSSTWPMEMSTTESK